ncbi:helix-turn-helix transcriptional regulator [Bradyrhizobium diazoefficiens]|uniref:helix-turn-helix domain-containing protein n=1 Tax=Bradyrhizobium diazoefficiens TaxID=1355477 RepID=UPI00272B7A92|nr:helix-turn-helix transcriptional regulator [Bradyrhizobium diazoefficiens]WLA74283.1 helix-turn-helix transcriptional regulator [Bradyrhizobium diazoefficiens]
MAKLSTRAARIETAAETAFGPRGMTQLATATGVSQQMLSFIVRGERPVSDDAYRKIAAAIAAEAARMRVAGAQLEKMARQMLRELEE